MFILRIMYYTVAIEYIVNVRMQLVTVCDLLITEGRRGVLHGGRCINKVKSSV